MAQVPNLFLIQNGNADHLILLVIEINGTGTAFVLYCTVFVKTS
jgi:hypothetical protein